MSNVVSIVKNIFRPYYRRWKKYRIKLYHKKQVKRLFSIDTKDKHKIFYLGITAHSNLGDMAQYYCIRTWLKSNYSDYEVFEFEANVVVDSRFGFIEELKALLSPKDMIVFQSGYTTQDLGGVHDLMHRLIIDNMPYANILMMPQTIFFKKEENKLRTAYSYNQAKNMLFLARDNVSYQMALAMFPDVHIKPFPDIVTTLIGHFNFYHKRDGILICRRNDGEKFYSEEQIIDLKNKIEEFELVSISDTTIKRSYKTIRKDLKGFVEGIIEDYSKYKLIITDRYHGTIFSLAANTPVIVIKTTDHKVTTGVDWFKGVYNKYAFKADSLEEVLTLTKQILFFEYDYRLNPYFDKEYYGKLKPFFENVYNHNLSKQ